MNREILKSMDTGHIPVQRLTALLETFTLKHAARMLPDLLETADLQDSSCREFLLAVLETEVKGRNERRRKRNYSAAHFPPNIRLLWSSIFVTPVAKKYRFMQFELDRVFDTR